ELMRTVQLILVLIFLYTVSVFAQLSKPRPPNSARAATATASTTQKPSRQTATEIFEGPFAQDTTVAQQQEPYILVTPQDRPIDPEKYIIGPGDEIAIAVIGPYTQHFNCQVFPEGKIYIPNLDVFQIEKNENFAHLRDRLKDYLNNQFKESRFEIFLSRLKTFRVSIAGEIYHPGFYTVNGNSRLMDIVKAAGFKPTSSSRKIKIFRDSTTLDCDLLYALYTDDLTGNPYLNMGDRIFLPANEPLYDKISIYGAVNKPGDFEYRNGDTVGRIIQLALGLWTNADSEHVKITRFISNESQYKEIIVSFKTQPDFPLKSDDRVMVYERSNFREKYVVHIIGEVKYPGYYPIVEGKTRLSEVIEAAGGFTEYASLFQAQMQRMKREEWVDPELSRLNRMLVSDMNDIEREYWKIRNREKLNLVAVDFEKLFIENRQKYNVELRNGDLITIPKVTRSVTVSGAVLNPGIQTFKQGANYKDYIAIAGGFNRKARKSRIQIIKPRTGTWYDASTKIPIEEGDIIFIPEKPLRDYWEIFKDTLT
ncbi:MAG TPA: hypothetical protein ENK14_13790, partial [Caldithrix sp.]|nr:hypothetical protein [Caldithrix sp.]